MVDTVRTQTALQALLADNVAGDISAQDVRDFLVSVYPQRHVVSLLGFKELGTGVTTGTVDAAGRWPALLYDATVQEGAGWGGTVLPYGWATVNLWIAWSKSHTNAGNVMWGGNLDSAADGETTNASGAAFTDTTIASPTQYLLSIDQIGAAVAVDPVPDVFNLRLFRRGNNAADTMAGDAALVAVWLERAS